MYNLEISMGFIITELVYICLGASWRTSPGAGVSRYIVDPLVAYGCCLLFGRVVVALAHSPFPFWTLYLSFLFDKSNISLIAIFYLILKLRKEMGNVSKRQQSDHRADNSRRPPMGLQCSEKLPHPEASFSWPLSNRHTSSVKMDVILNSELYTRN